MYEEEHCVCDSHHYHHYLCDLLVQPLGLPSGQRGRVRGPPQNGTLHGELMGEDEVHQRMEYFMVEFMDEGEFHPRKEHFMMSSLVRVKSQWKSSW